MPLQVTSEEPIWHTLAPMTTLLVAAGGGGDVIGSLLIRRLVAPGEQPLIATCAWERLRIDPDPGPRALTGFSLLGDLDGRQVEVRPDTHTQPPGRSTLPRLVQDTGARVFVVELERGAVGVAQQLTHILRALNANRALVVDVGGDVIASGDEAGLLSPLADALMLAGAFMTDVPVTLAVAGPGLDGELSADEVGQRLKELKARRIGTVLPSDVEAMKPLLKWHPTEASALLAAIALGIRGAVETRRGGAPVPLTSVSAAVWTLDIRDLAPFPIANGCLRTETLGEAETVVDQFCPNELRYERAKAAEMSPHTQHRTVPDLLQRAREVGATAPLTTTHITMRRLLERVDAPPAMTDDLVKALEDNCRRDGPLWALRELALLH